MTRMLAIASSIGKSSFAPSTIAREKSSPCSVYWSQSGNVSTAPSAAEEIGAVVDGDLGRPVGRGVERDHDLDPTLGAHDRHALIADDCVPTVKVRWRPPGNRAARSPAGRYRTSGRGRCGHDPGRLRAEDVARGEDRVAADVVEPAAAGRPVAHVGGVGVE